jgi:hypothetical protein
VKKNILIFTIFLALLVALPGYAQFQVGPVVGANLSGLNISPRDAGVTTNIKSGYAFGAVIAYDFSPMFSIQLQPVYIQKGGLIKSAQTDMGLILEIEQTVDVNYIDVPLLLKVSFEGESIKPFLFAGFDVAFSLDDSLKFTVNNVTVNGQDYTQELPSELIEQKLKSKKMEYSILFGAGISIPVGILDLFIQAQYNLGLSNVNGEYEWLQPEHGPKLNNRGLQVMTGVLYSF